MQRERKGREPRTARWRRGARTRALQRCGAAGAGREDGHKAKQRQRRQLAWQSKLRARLPQLQHGAELHNAAPYEAQGRPHTDQTAHAPRQHAVAIAALEQAAVPEPTGRYLSDSGQSRPELATAPCIVAAAGLTRARRIRHAGAGAANERRKKALAAGGSSSTAEAAQPLPARTHPTGQLSADEQTKTGRCDRAAKQQTRGRSTVQRSYKGSRGRSAAP